MLPEPLPLQSWATTNRQQRQALIVGGACLAHQPPLVLLGSLKLRRFVAVVLSTCAKIASIHILSYGGWLLTRHDAESHEVADTHRFFRLAASALSLRNGRERGHTSAKKCTSDAVSASSLRP